MKIEKNKWLWAGMLAFSLALGGCGGGTTDDTTDDGNDGGGDTTTNLQKVKDFVTDVRTWSTVIESDTASNTFGNELYMASQVFGNGESQAPMWLAFITQAMVTAWENGQTDLSNVTGMSYGDYWNGTTWVEQTVNVSGTMNVNASQGTTVTLTVATADLSYVDSSGQTISATATNMSVTLPAATGSVSTLTAGISGTVEGEYDRMVVANTSTATVTLSQAVDLAAWYAGTATVGDKVSSMALDLDATLANKVTCDAAGTCTTATDPVTFAGDLSVGTGPLGSYVSWDGQTDYGPGSLTVSANGTFSNSTDSFDAALTASGTNLSWRDAQYIEGQPYDVATLTYNTADELVVTYIDGSTMTATWTDAPAGEMYTGTVTTAYDGPNGWVTDAAHTVYMETSLGEWAEAYPWYILFHNWNAPTGYYTVPVEEAGEFLVADVDFSTSQTVSGTLQSNWEDCCLEDTADSWADVDFNLTFTADLEGAPEAVFSVTGDRTDFRAGTADMTITYTNSDGVRSLSIDAAATQSTANDGSVIEEDPTFSITITNPDGMEIVLTDFAMDNLGNVTGTVKYNGENYATISGDQLGLKITYSDQTFEYL